MPMIATPPTAHYCEPGWRYETGRDGRSYGAPPLASDFPRGTVWKCECGRTWVSCGATVRAAHSQKPRHARMHSAAKGKGHDKKKRAAKRSGFDPCPHCGHHMTHRRDRSYHE